MIGRDHSRLRGKVALVPANCAIATQPEETQMQENSREQ